RRQPPPIDGREPPMPIVVAAMARISMSPEPSVELDDDPMKPGDAADEDAAEDDEAAAFEGPLASAARLFSENRTEFSLRAPLRPAAGAGSERADTPAPPASPNRSLPPPL